MKEHRIRASQAFNAAFRDRLANAVQARLLHGIQVGFGRWCRCPLGCLTAAWCPHSVMLVELFGFARHQFIDFIESFECGTDYGTPEAALGFLYRARFTKERLKV